MDKQPQYIQLIIQLRDALQTSYQQLTGLAPKREEWAVAEDVGFALEAADKYLQAFTNLSPAVVAGLFQTDPYLAALFEQARKVIAPDDPAINSGLPKDPFVAVLIEQGALMTFVTNLPDPNIRYMQIHYDQEDEIPVSVGMDRAEWIVGPLSEEIGRIQDQYIAEGNASAYDQLKELKC